MFSYYTIQVTGSPLFVEETHIEKEVSDVYILLGEDKECFPEPLALKIVENFDYLNLVLHLEK